MPPVKASGEIKLRQSSEKKGYTADKEASEQAGEDNEDQIVQAENVVDVEESDDFDIRKEQMRKFELEAVELDKQVL